MSVGNFREKNKMARSETFERKNKFETKAKQQ
jgi:hypothetical protein